ncbi:MAG: hypothetical protein ABS39_15620 [Acidovorax sp. SCN 65-28]|nr:MAG: hypothetical protein ABS39_15620 [Acidovorax sp. SCN 65-28]
MCQFCDVYLFLPNFNDKLVITLIRAVLPLAARLNKHPYALTRLAGSNKLHRRAKVCNIHLSTQSFGQRGAHELDNNTFGLLLQINSHLATGQIYNYSTSTIRAPTKIHIFQWQYVII